VLADDEVLLGSHNWSLSSFALSTQDSVWFQSPELSAYLCDAFARSGCGAQRLSRSERLPHRLGSDDRSRAGR
jgi:phosphatidylserine/phosphatidylglycerophosphate/cardiolipin synthase-like enzyme